MATRKRASRARHFVFIPEEEPPKAEAGAGSSGSEAKPAESEISAAEVLGRRSRKRRR